MSSYSTCSSFLHPACQSHVRFSSQNPTLQALYPLDSTLTILRTLNTTLTPSQGLTSFGSSGSIYAQLWYSGVEQFYCTASSCSQTSPSGNGTSTWSCHNLACTCRPGTTFCGAVPVSNLTATIDGLNEDLTIACGALDPNNGTATCSFQQSVLTSLFGSGGLSLSGCVFGECLAQGVIDSVEGNTTDDGQSNGGGGTQLSSGVIAGLAVVGGLIGLVLLGLLIGLWSQRKVKKGGKGLDAERDHGGVAVEWKDVNYTVPVAGGRNWLGVRRSMALDKIVLAGVSGRVEPGQMMGILGPSGTWLAELHYGNMSFDATGSRCRKDYSYRNSRWQEQIRLHHRPNPLPLHLFNFPPLPNRLRPSARHPSINSYRLRSSSLRCSSASPRVCL